MFIDWLSCHQDYDFELPIIAKDGYQVINFEDGDVSQIRQNKVQHAGSFSTSIQIKVTSQRVSISGNPSRFNRIDNLIGLSSVDACVAVYNQILLGLGLPPFTKCKQLGFIEKHTHGTDKIKLEQVADGCTITEIHVTSNFSVGKGCETSYLKAVSMLPYKNSVPRLHTNGMTVDWLSKLGNSRLEYPKIYNKANEIRLHSLPNIKRKYGEQSPEYQYILDLVNHCEENGVLRAEQKLRSPFLKLNDLSYWGLSDYSKLNDIHKEFKNIDQKLKVSHMNLMTLTETLISEKICTNTKAANITALYAINWMNGEKFDLSKTQVQTHRARLRQIGIDIAKPCNLTVFSPVILKEVIEIEKREYQAPSFYQHPKPFLQLVA